MLDGGKFIFHSNFVSYNVDESYKRGGQFVGFSADNFQLRKESSINKNNNKNNIRI